MVLDRILFWSRVLGGSCFRLRLFSGLVLVMLLSRVVIMLVLLVVLMLSRLFGISG